MIPRKNINEAFISPTQQTSKAILYQVEHTVSNIERKIDELQNRNQAKKNLKVTSVRQTRLKK